MPLWIGVGLLVALAFFVALFTSVVRERDFALPLPRLGDLETALPTLAGATGGAPSPVSPGGAFWDPGAVA